jgi:hypothetical protein
LPQNLLEATWTDLDSDELRVLLQHRFGNSLGQYDGDDGKLYLPAAGGQSRIALTFEGAKIATVEPGAAFDANEWEGVHREIEHSLLAGVPKVGRDYSFSSLPVQGSWRGARSGVQLIPAPTGAPRYGGADDPFILEFPIKGSDLFFITNHRRLREHRKFTLLLNLLLKGRLSCLPRRHGHFWASVPPEEGKTFPNIQWVEEWYYGPLDAIVLDEHTSFSDRMLEEVDPGDYYAKIVGSDSLRLPTDLDAQICGYIELSPDHREKFDRALFWLDMSARQWTASVSAAFAALVSAIEALTERGDRHHFNCPVCGKQTQHEEPGATRRFKDFIETYAADAGTARRGKVYPLRSGILHGSKLIEIDYALAFGWDPPWFDQLETHWELSTITRVALREWLKRHSVSASGSRAPTGY